MVEIADCDPDEDIANERCEYCYNTDPNCLVQCFDPSCKKWFCNCRIKGVTGSQIIWHLARTGHNIIKRSSRNRLNQIDLKCYWCHEKNIFCLGFFSLAGGKKLVTICRNQCLEEQCAKNPDLRNQFVYFILDRRLLEVIVADTTMKCSTIVTLPHIQQVERSFDSEFTMEDSLLSKPESYESPESYITTMNYFVELLREHEKYSNRNQIQTDVSIEWSEVKNCKVTKGCYYRANTITADFLPGLELNISDRSWINCKAVVMEVKGDMVFFSTNILSEDLENKLFDVQVIGNFITHNRLSDATVSFANIGDELQQRVLRPNDFPLQPSEFPVLCPPNKTFNESQSTAIVKAMTQPISLIQGPPGTGKTYTSAMIVYNYLKSELHNGPALVCASSNTATDNLSEKLLELKLKVVRVISTSKEIAPQLKDITLHELAKKACNDAQAAYNASIEEREKGEDDSLEPSPKSKGRSRRSGMRGGDEEEGPSRNPKTYYKEVLRAADVVCCTCSTAGSRVMQDLPRANFVLIDEATQSIEPETLIPLSKLPLRVVLVGDQNQLGPTAMIRRADQLGYYKSLFQRLIDNGYDYTMLNSQFRMHPKLSLYPSQAYYEGRVIDGITEADRALPIEFAQIWPKIDIPIVFHHISQYEELNPSGLSYLNRHEYIRILDILMKLNELGVDMAEVGLITPYEGQVAMIKEKFKILDADDPSYKFEDIQVSSIDGFQGKEKDFIIISCVRSNKRSGIGFLNNRNRLNVALTRARKGLALVGNVKVLMKDEVWDDYLQFLKGHDLIAIKEEESDEREEIIEMLRRKKKNGVRLLPMPEFTNECFDNAMIYGNIYGDLSKTPAPPSLDLAVMAKGDWAKTDLGSELRKQQFYVKFPGRSEEEVKDTSKFSLRDTQESKQETKPKSSLFANLKVIRPGNTKPLSPSAVAAVAPAKPRVNFKNPKDRSVADLLGFTVQTSRYS
jgi:regulator of nonsense transcripts 1